MLTYLSRCDEGGLGFAVMCKAHVMQEHEAGQPLALPDLLVSFFRRYASYPFETHAVVSR